MNDAIRAASILLIDSELPQQPVGPFVMRSRLSDELRAASLRLSAQRDSTQVSIIVAYRLPDNYQPRRLHTAPFVPIDENCSWWRVPGTKHFGVTDDSRLTIDDSTHQRPAVVCLRTFHLTALDTYMLITGLQSMPLEPANET
jgi:hypothetical protein